MHAKQRIPNDRKITTGIHDAEIRFREWGDLEFRKMTASNYTVLTVDKVSCNWIACIRSSVPIRPPVSLVGPIDVEIIFPRSDTNFKIEDYAVIVQYELPRVLDVRDLESSSEFECVLQKYPWRDRSMFAEGVFDAIGGGG